MFVTLRVPVSLHIPYCLLLRTASHQIPYHVQQRNSLSNMRLLCFPAMRIGMYQPIKQLLPATEEPLVQQITAGMISGASAVFIFNPLELIKVLTRIYSLAAWRIGFADATDVMINNTATLHDAA